MFVEKAETMTRMKKKLVAGAGLAALLLGGSVAFAQTGQNVDWPNYAGDITGSSYKPLDQINASNFSKLEVAWRFKTDNLGNRPEFKLEGTPLEVGGVVYATAGSRRAVVALDAVTGELLWVHGEKEGARGAAAPRQLSGRGLAYWSDGKEARILYVTPGYQLIALDAKTGQRIAELRQQWRGRPEGGRRPEDLARPDHRRNRLAVGADRGGRQGAGRFGLPRRLHAHQLHATTRARRAPIDVRTGKRLWQFHTIPQKGEPGAETWLNGSNEYTGNTGVWTEITADPVANLAYLPVESPTSRFLWRQASGQQSLRQQPGGGGSRYRQAEMALPVHPSRDLGL